MKRVVQFLILCMMFISANAFAAAGYATYVLQNVQDARDMQQLQFRWVGSTSDGTVPDKSTTEVVHGWIVKVCTTISASATDNYDVYIEDNNGASLTGTQVENRDTTAAECVTLTEKARVDSIITLDLDGNSDTSSGGTIDVYILLD